MRIQLDVAVYWRLKSFFDRSSTRARRITGGAFLMMFVSAAATAAALTQ